MNSSLFTRHLFIIGCIIFLVLGGSTVVNVYELRQENLTNLESKATSILTPILNEVRQLTSHSANYNWALKIQSINATEAFNEHARSGVVEIVILDKQQQVIAHNDVKQIGKALPDAQKQLAKQLSGISVIGDSFYTVTPINTSSLDTIGTAIVRFDSKQFNQKVTELLLRSITLFAFFLVIGMGLTYFFVKKYLATPLKQLVATSQQISSGNYQVGIDVSSRDEFGQLAKGFATMQAAISDKISALEAHKAGLEAEVSKRTQEYLSAKEQAEQSNLAKSRFLANMSHELRTPLNAVLGYSQILKSTETNHDKIRYLESINSAGQTLLSLIDEVLDLSKIEAGKMSLQLAPYSPHELLQEMNAMFLHRAAERDVALNISCQQRVPQYLLVDSLKIKQILMNLCSNAIKFTTNGDVNVEIGLESHFEGQGRVDLFIKVSDTGKGIPIDQQGLIFKAFEQVKGQSISEYGGTGLGLAITAKLVALMGGTIHVESQGVGCGSVFTIHLPEVEVTHAPLNAEQDLAIDLSQLQFKPCDILIVDDIPYNRELIQSYLGALPFTIRHAENGMQALAMVEKQKPHVVITDLKMPEMDGLTLCQHLRFAYDHQALKIVMVTASALPEDKAAVKAYVDLFLTKPIDQTTLLNGLARLLNTEIIPQPDHSSPVLNLSSQCRMENLSMSEREMLLHLVDIEDIESIRDFCQRLPRQQQDIQQWVLKHLETKNLLTIKNAINKVSL